MGESGHPRAWCAVWSAGGIARLTHDARADIGIGAQQEIGGDVLKRHRHEQPGIDQRRHGNAPGARELLDFLTKNESPWAVATSGLMETAKLNLDALGIDPAVVPVVTRDQVKFAKPDPDLFGEHS